MYKEVYIKTHGLKFDCDEFSYDNVEINNDEKFLTIYDSDGKLWFRCPMENVDEFVRIG